MMGSELGSTVWATSLTRDPSKSAHIGARFLVIAVASLVGDAAGIAGLGGRVAIASPGEGGPASTNGWTWFGRWG